MTKTTNDDFCFEWLSHKQFAFFCVLIVLFFFSFFTLLHKCIDVIEMEEKLLLTGKLFPSKINLIEYNPVEGLPFSKTDSEKAEKLLKYMVVCV